MEFYQYVSVFDWMIIICVWNRFCFKHCCFCPLSVGSLRFQVHVIVSIAIYFFFFNSCSSDRLQKSVHIFCLNSNRYLTKSALSPVTSCVGILSFGRHTPRRRPNQRTTILRGCTLNTVWCQRTLSEWQSELDGICGEMDNIQMVSLPFFSHFFPLFFSRSQWRRSSTSHSLVLLLATFFPSVCMYTFQCYRHRNRARSIKCVLNGFLLLSQYVGNVFVQLFPHSQAPSL